MNSMLIALVLTKSKSGVMRTGKERGEQSLLPHSSRSDTAFLIDGDVVLRAEHVEQTQRLLPKYWSPRLFALTCRLRGNDARTSWHVNNSYRQLLLSLLQYTRSRISRLPHLFNSLFQS